MIKIIIHIFALLKTCARYNRKLYKNPLSVFYIALFFWYPKKELVHHIHSIGPLSIKAGQILATRSDIFSKNITQELKKLKDNVPPLPLEEIKKNFPQISGIIGNQLLGSGSIAQVHNLKKNIHDYPCIIKVIRPNLYKRIQREKLILILFINVLSCIFIRRRKRISYVKKIILNEYLISLQEMNLVQEKKALRKMHKILLIKPFFKVPRVPSQDNNNNFLIMEKISGFTIESISSWPYQKRKKVINNITRSFLLPLYSQGIMHGDMHTRNIIVHDDASISLIDLGRIGYFSTQERNTLYEITMSILQKNYYKISLILLEENYIKPKYKNFSESKLERDIFNLFSNLYHRNCTTKNFSNFMRMFLHTFTRKYSIETPYNITLLQKNMIFLEDIRTELKLSNVNIIDIIRKPIIEYKILNLFNYF